MSIKQIDTGKCVGCGTCVNSCSMDVIRLDHFLSNKNDITPCRTACPAGVNMRAYIQMLVQGKIDEAIELIREELPIPAITGHVCFHPCENECARKEVDEAVNINALERFVADYVINEKPEPALLIYSRKVAVIGSGPAGLTAACQLVEKGYPVTIFESESLPGGMLRYGIPEYRLPENVLNAQIRYIEGLGVEIKTGVKFGKDMTLEDLKNKGYDAVLFAIGAQLSRLINIEGSELDNVIWGMDFLRDVKIKRKVDIRSDVVVIGGGNVAIDAALTARRLGAENIRVVCLECREEMPAHEESLRTAVDEGIEIDASWGPGKIIGDKGKVTGIEIVRCLSIFSESGEFEACFDKNENRIIETEMVIFAIGEKVDLSFLPEEIKNDGNHITADPITLETSLPGIFAAGVAVTGPGSVVEAVASGKKAVESIDRYLRGKDIKSGRECRDNIIENPPRDGVEKKPRQKINLLPLNLRKGDFNEIKKGLTEENAELEAKRCMACGSRAYIKYFSDCMTCYTCEKDCPEKAIFVSPEHIPVGVSSWG